MKIPAVALMLSVVFAHQAAARDCKPVRGTQLTVNSGQEYRLDLSTTKIGAKEVRIEESLLFDFSESKSLTYVVASSSEPTFEHYALAKTRVYYRVTALNADDPNFVPCTWTDMVDVNADPALRDFRNAVVPVVGSVDGALGSRFRTSMTLFNDAGQDLRGKLIFHPANRSASSSDPQLAFRLDMNETLTFDDVVAAVGGSGLGSLDIVLDDNSPKWIPAVQTRIFNERADGGTLGMSVPTVLIRNFGSGAVTQAVVPNPAKARMNVGIRTWFLGADLIITRIRNGVSTGKIVSYPDNYFTQITAQELLGEPLLEGDVLQINPIGAVVYFSINDNITNDPLMIIPYADESGRSVYEWFN